MISIKYRMNLRIVLYDIELINNCSLHLQTKISRNYMKTLAANKKLEEIIANVEKEGIKIESLTDELKELRKTALLEKDPLVVKVLRLTYEYLEEKKAFDVQAQYEEDEEENEYPIEIEDQENLSYLLSLLLKADHKVNREEIKDYRTALKESMY